MKLVCSIEMQAHYSLLKLWPYVYQEKFYAKVNFGCSGIFMENMKYIFSKTIAASDLKARLLFDLRQMSLRFQT